MGEPQAVGAIIPDVVARIERAAERAAAQPPGPVLPASVTRGPQPSVPDRYRSGFDFTADGRRFELDKAGQTVREWAEQWRPDAKWLVLAGSVGRGKSSLAGAAATVIGDPWVARYVWVPGLLKRIKADFDAGAAEVERLTRVRCLILDDVGAERGTDWEVSQLAYLLESRYDRPGTLMLTTNLDRGQLAQRVGVRAVSRLVERCAWLTLTGPDRRAVR